jgi:hypothetical protein
VRIRNTIVSADRPARGVIGTPVVFNRAQAEFERVTRGPAAAAGPRRRRDRERAAVRGALPNRPREWTVRSNAIPTAMAVIDDAGASRYNSRALQLGAISRRIASSAARQFFYERRG